MPVPSKSQRLLEFFRRLTLAPPATDHQAAFALLSETLQEVEDELTAIPNDPEAWQDDGRLYPPQADSIRPVPGRDDVVRYRSLRHNTYIRSNGAIEIQEVGNGGVVVFAKTGADGAGVWE